MDDRLLPAVQKAYDLNRWLLPHLAKLPRAYKFTLGDRLQVTALDLCLALVEAGHASAKDRPLYRADRLLDQLRILLRLAHDLGLFPAQRYEHAAERVAELGRMLGGWKKRAAAKRVAEPSPAEAAAPP